MAVAIFMIMMLTKGREPEIGEAIIHSSCISRGPLRLADLRCSGNIVRARCEFDPKSDIFLYFFTFFFSCDADIVRN